MAEFEVGGKKYSARRLDAFTAIYVGIKIMPAVGPFMEAIGPASAALTAAKSGNASMEMLGGTFKAIDPLVKIIAGMPKADIDFVIKTCLSVVSRADDKGAGWAPVWNEAADRLQFDDIGPMEVLGIAAKVIQADLKPFTPAPP